MNLFMFSSRLDVILRPSLLLEFRERSRNRFSWQGNYFCDISRGVRISGKTARNALVALANQRTRAEVRITTTSNCLENTTITQKVTCYPAAVTCTLASKSPRIPESASPTRQ